MGRPVNDAMNDAMNDANKDAAPHRSENLGGTVDANTLADHLDSTRRLLAFIRSIASDRLLGVVEADDLVQEVCTAAITGLATAPLDRYSLDDWLRQLCRRRVVDAHRHHFTAARRDAGRNVGGGDGENRQLQHWLVASITSPSAAVSQDVRLAAMRRAIDSLPEDQQRAIRMRYLKIVARQKLPSRSAAPKRPRGCCCPAASVRSKKRSRRCVRPALSLRVDQTCWRNSNPSASAIRSTSAIQAANDALSLLVNRS